jgi:hypothetical protein
MGTGKHDRKNILVQFSLLTFHLLEGDSPAGYGIVRLFGGQGFRAALGQDGGCGAAVRRPPGPVR